jgi:hypothetical protein
LQRSCPGRAFRFMAVSIFTHLLTDQC